ncbi:MAG: hypothetical protein NVSMB62_19860 [Acidobacteriaceae bacterium]
MLASLKMLTVFVVLGAVAGVVGIPYSILVRDVRPLYRAIMAIMRAGIRAAGIRVDVSGKQNIPQGVSCIFLANHVSNLDPPILFPVIPPMASVLLKQELMRIPLLGTAMRMGNFVPVERTNSRESAKRSIDAAGNVLRAGMHLLVFPEGTRSPDGRLQPFKKGPFFLAQQTGALIVPIAISGPERMMGRGSSTLRPGTAKVQILAAIDPKRFRSRDQLMAAVHAAIAAALPEEMRPAPAPVS